MIRTRTDYTLSVYEKDSTQIKGTFRGSNCDVRIDMYNINIDTGDMVNREGSISLKTLVDNYIQDKYRYG